MPEPLLYAVGPANMERGRIIPPGPRFKGMVLDVDQHRLLAAPQGNGLPDLLSINIYADSDRRLLSIPCLSEQCMNRTDM